MVNTELLERTMRFIDEHEDNWNQKVWARRDLPDVPLTPLDPTNAACGTAACFAGWTCLLSEVPLRIGFTACGGLSWASAHDIPLVARKALGITEREADVLFFPDNSLESLHLMVKELTTFGCLSEDTIATSAWAEDQESQQ